jgi:hypothetical protein
MIGCSSPGRGWEFFSSPPCPDLVGGPPSLLSSGYQGLFPWGSSGRCVKLTTRLNLLPRSRIRGAVPSLPQYAFMAWFLIKAQGQLYFYLYWIWIVLKPDLLPLNMLYVSIYVAYEGFLVQQVWHQITSSANSHNWLHNTKHSETSGRKRMHVQYACFNNKM